MQEPYTNGKSGDHGAGGRFSPGNRAGAGHGRPRYKTSELRDAMIAAVSPETITDIVTKLIELALDGDVRAAEMVLDRTIGRPVSVAENMDEDELEKDERQQQPVPLTDEQRRLGLLAIIAEHRAKLQSNN